MVCPTSGCEINNKIIGKINIKLKKYLEKLFFCFSVVKIKDKTTIKKGFNISTGWNLGINGKSIQRIEPLTSTPINGTRTKKIKDTKKKNLQIKNNFFLSKAENIVKTIIPIIINTRCLKKK